MQELPNIVVILVEPENPGNVGFVSRVLANFGVRELRVVGCDPREDSQAQIFSVHAINLLESARVYNNLESALKEIDAAWAATARAGGNQSVTRALVPLEDLPNPLALDGRVALVFGRESTGLTNEEIGLCDFAFTIPTSEEYPSLNLSHAVAIVLFHLFSKYSPPKPPEVTATRAATREEREQVLVFFDELIDRLYLQEFKRPIAKQVMRNLLGRAYMTGREITTLTGIVRRINELIKDRQDNED
ncbi:RNA methyltransferase [Candidatus Thorarchaeota archaeon]|nr:MAG: RNA methyltransferase [Candidatus Thorarchaeota archaeon]